MVKLENQTLIVVADGARMLLLENRGNVLKLDLHVVEHCERPIALGRESVSGPQPATATSARRGQNRIKAPDPHQLDEDRFLLSVAERLDDWSSSAKALVVAAAPRALGTLRRLYTPGVRTLLVAEIDKDLTRHTVETIARMVAAYDSN